MLDQIEILKLHDAHYHDAVLVDRNLNFIADQVLGTKFKSSELADIVKNFRSLPKAYWSFKRKIAEKIFPMPDDLPVEDEWISFVIKKYSESIAYIREPLYYYRQHEGQDYGGILNYEFDKVSFRAARLIKVAMIVNEKMFSNELDIEQTLKFLQLQTKRSSTIEIVKSPITIRNKAKLFLVLKLPYVTTILLKAKLLFQR